MSETHPVIDRYLTQLNESLSTLPAADRQEILHDIRGHFAEATAGRRSVESTLEALGPADALRRAYTVELMLNPRRPVSSRAAYRFKIAGRGNDARRPDGHPRAASLRAARRGHLARDAAETRRLKLVTRLCGSGFGRNQPST